MLWLSITGMKAFPGILNNNHLNLYPPNLVFLSLSIQSIKNDLSLALIVHIFQKFVNVWEDTWDLGTAAAVSVKAHFFQKARNGLIIFFHFATTPVSYNTPQTEKCPNVPFSCPKQPCLYNVSSKKSVSSCPSGKALAMTLPHHCCSHEASYFPTLPTAFGFAKLCMLQNMLQQ